MILWKRCAHYQRLFHIFGKLSLQKYQRHRFSPP